jgi:hypothetical protein
VEDREEKMSERGELREDEGKGRGKADVELWARRVA